MSCQVFLLVSSLINVMKSGFHLFFLMRFLSSRFKSICLFIYFFAAFWISLWDIINAVSWKAILSLIYFYITSSLCYILKRRWFLYLISVTLLNFHQSIGTLESFIILSFLIVLNCYT